MVPSRGQHREGTNKWLIKTLILLCSSTSLAGTDALLSIDDPPLPASSRHSQAGRSPAEIPLLNHDVHTAKFRNTNTNTHPSEEIEKYQKALAPADHVSAVRAPPAQSVESRGLSPLGQARLLSDWEVDDIVLLSTVDGHLHARDRRTGRERWSLGIENSPMIETIHHAPNRSDGDHLQAIDYIFIVEPSSDGQLYAQFPDHRGLQRLPATVRKMATEVPSAMHFNGHTLATTSTQETKAYTIDAQTGEILYEFPRSKSGIKSDMQPRCPPRSGLGFEDPACKPGRTLRLGRNTYIFTISNERSGQDLCTIRFSEWVTNKLDKDLQAQHTKSLDGYDLRVFHNGWVMGLDTTGDPDRQIRYKQKLESPVARVFDVVRKLNAEDDTTDLALLSRNASFVTSNDAAPMRQDPNIDQRVFIDRTEAGQWYALSEYSYPGVTSTALLAKAVQESYTKPLDLYGDMSDIIGVHPLAQKHFPPRARLSEGRLPEIDAPAPSANVDLILEPPKGLSVTGEDKTISSRISDGFWGGVLTLAICVLAYAWRHYSKAGRKAFLAEIAASSVPNISAPVTVEAPQLPNQIINGKLDDPVAPLTSSDLEMAPTTSLHSRVASLTSASSPKKEDDTGSESEDDDTTSGAVQTEEKKKKKTKRGVRGGRRNKRKGDATTFEPKPVMSAEKHLKDGMVQVGRLTYDSTLENCLGQGSSGTAVFPGTFDGRCVAVKRLVKTANSLAEKEIRHLVSSDEHPNVIRYHGKEESPSFFYIALDRFDTSLDQFVEHYERFPSLVSPTRGYDIKDALRQITRGVQHLHSLKLVHRDIKPQNILVRPVKTNRPAPEGQLQPLLFVISDFGLCKPLEDGPESVFAATRTAAGTTGWKAPELLVSSRDAIAAPLASLEQSQSSQSHSLSRSATISSSVSDGGTAIDPPTGRRATKAIDIFSLGCVFFYVMTRGGHPFDTGGSFLARDLNIKEDKYDTSLLRDSFVGYDYDADDLIMQMIMHNPKLRPDTSGILQHPYFWKVEHKLDFICAVSDAYEERKQKITNIHDENAPRTDLETEYLAELAALQAKAENVIGLRKDGNLQDFLQALPKSFLNEMGKQRKYTGTKMIDLLRVIRNKKNHFHDLPTDVKDLMMRSGCPPGMSENKSIIEGYYSFWRERFPSLLVNCHQLLHERNLVDECGLQRYYDGTLN